MEPSSSVLPPSHETIDQYRDYMHCHVTCRKRWRRVDPSTNSRGGSGNSRVEVTHVIAACGRIAVRDSKGPSGPATAPTTAE
ncbi:DUF397 domain-containing protein [Streptomyces violaceusniger]